MNPTAFGGNIKKTHRHLKGIFLGIESAPEMEVEQ